jgi:thiol:disulfide interchange protein DsbD
LPAQGNNVLSVAPVERLRVHRGSTAVAKVRLQLKPGYHVNSSKPADDYLIPMKLTWAADPLKAEDVEYPKPTMEKYPFSEKPLSVYSGDFDVVTKFKVPANAPAGPALATGKLRYQACNDRMCLPPKTIEVPLTIEIQ